MFLVVHTFGVAHITSFPPQHSFTSVELLQPAVLYKTFIFFGPVLAEFLKAICSNLNVLHIVQIKSREGGTRWNCTFNTVMGKRTNNINKNVKMKIDEVVIP